MPSCPPFFYHFCSRSLHFVCAVCRGQETDEKFAGEAGTTWAEQTDAEERAAAAERQVYAFPHYLVLREF